MHIAFLFAAVSLSVALPAAAGGIYFTNQNCSGLPPLVEFADSSGGTQTVVPRSSGRCENSTDIDFDPVSQRLLFQGGSGEGSIFSVGTDGTDKQVFFSPGANSSGQDIDLIARRLFFVEGMGRISYQGLDGGGYGSALALPSNSVAGLAVDPLSQLIYFGLYGANSSDSLPDFSVWRIGVDGSGLSLLTMSDGFIFDMAFSANNDEIYWTALGQIVAYSLSTGTQRVLIDAQGIAGLESMAVRRLRFDQDDGYLYWTAFTRTAGTDDSEIYRIRPDGSGLQLLIGGLTGDPTGLTLGPTPVLQPPSVPEPGTLALLSLGLLGLGLTARRRLH